MIVLIVLDILWMSFLVVRLMLRAGHPSTPTQTHPQQVRAEPSRAQFDSGGQDGPAWNAWDDHQLTRLLSDSAPRTITE